MPLRFFKYHGLGNDFIVLDEILHGPQNPPPAHVLCDRNRGIGADGILHLSRINNALTMRIVNADGSPAQMCGNGVRCIARHLCERHALTADSFTLHTGRGPLTIEISRDRAAFLAATVDMGEPILEPARIPVICASNPLSIPRPSLLETPWSRAAGLAPTISAVSMGNPHAIIECTNPDAVPLRDIGPTIERSTLFPEGTNVHFVHVLSPDAVRIITWERGAGATLACGTGACAVVVALASLGRTSRRVRVDVPGGTLLIEWSNTTNRVRMRGPATFVFEGQFSPQDPTDSRTP